MKKNYIIAEELEPECRNSDLDSFDFEEDGIYDGIVITGNKAFNFYGCHLDDISKVTDDDEIYDIVYDEALSDDEKIHEIESIIPGCSTDIADWKKAVDIDPVNIADILTAITGKSYDSEEIDGCVQSEWQNLYYPEGTSEDLIEEIRMKYFNLGTEWRVTINDDSEYVSSENTYYIYTTSYDEKGTKQEIANEFDVPADQIILRQYQGVDYGFNPEYIEKGGNSEKKDLFVEDLCHLLKKYGVEINDLSYHKNSGYDNEFVKIVTTGGREILTNVTGDNNLALGFDVLKDLLEIL